MTQSVDQSIIIITSINIIINYTYSKITQKDTQDHHTIVQGAVEKQGEKNSHFWNSLQSKQIILQNNLQTHLLPPHLS